MLLTILLACVKYRYPWYFGLPNVYRETQIRSVLYSRVINECIPTGLKCCYNRYTVVTIVQQAKRDNFVTSRVVRALEKIRYEFSGFCHDARARGRIPKSIATATIVTTTTMRTRERRRGRSASRWIPPIRFSLFRKNTWIPGIGSFKPKMVARAMYECTVCQFSCVQFPREDTGSLPRWQATIVSGVLHLSQTVSYRYHANSVERFQ